MLQLQATIAVVVGTGVANRVLYKLALVPMGGEGFMSGSLMPNFGWCLAHCCMPCCRLRFCAEPVPDIWVCAGVCQLASVQVQVTACCGPLLILSHMLLGDMLRKLHAR